MPGVGTAGSSPWKTLYQRYSEIQRRWLALGVDPPLARQLFRGAVHGFQDPVRVAREARALRLEPPPDDLLDEAFSIQQSLYPPSGDRPEGRQVDDPLEDVYAAALSMLPHGFWSESPDREQLYRGQRDARWTTIPSLFRKPNPAEALKSLAAAAARVRQALPRFDDAQAIAVAQHYSAELGISTWLLDVTWDPRVALFFASHQGGPGEVGLVTCMVRKEWERLSAGGTNRLGRLRVIEAPGILRIERQRASFIDTSHPDLFEQYVAHSVFFRQVEGLCFEDLDAEHPVSEVLLYPPEDPTLRVLCAAPAPASVPAMPIGPATDASEPLGAPAYLEITRSWCRQAGVEIDAYHEDALEIVCDVHAALQTRRSEFAVPERSLLRLEDAVQILVEAQGQGRFVTAGECLRFTMARLRDEQRAKVENLITGAARRRDSC